MTITLKKVLAPFLTESGHIWPNVIFLINYHQIFTVFSQNLMTVKGDVLTLKFPEGEEKYYPLYEKVDVEEDLIKFQDGTEARICQIVPLQIRL